MELSNFKQTLVEMQNYTDVDEFGVSSDKFTGSRLVTDVKGRIRNKWPYFQGYFQTFPALMRLSEIVFILVAFCMSLVERKFLATGGSWLVLTTSVAFVTSILFLIFHLFLLHRLLDAPWTLIEFGVGIFICILIFSGGVLSAAYSHISSMMIAQTVFLFLALAVYIVDELINFKILRAGRYYDSP